MWPKSSKRFADRVETDVLKLGFLGIAALFHTLPATPAASFMAPNPHALDLTPPTLEERIVNGKKARVWCVICLIFVPVFQILSYISCAQWGWWPFFSLLLFSSLALLVLALSAGFSYDVFDYSIATHTWLLAFVTLCSLLYCGSNIWPILMKDSGISGLSLFLIILQVFAALIIVYYSWKSSKDSRKQLDIKEKSDQH